jgi:hypothetical protein
VILPDDTPLGPYRALMGQPTPSFDAELHKAIQSAGEREALVASCMKEAGFDYFPMPYAGSMVEQVHPYLARASYMMVPGLDDDRADVEQWGYGLDSPGAEELFPGQAPEVQETEQKNLDYVAGLSVAAEHEYWAAMYGPDIDSEEARGADVQGCMGEALTQVPQDEMAFVVQGFRDTYWDLLVAVTDVSRWEVGNDPRAQALDAEWAACAATRGIDFSSMPFTNSEGQPLTDVPTLNRPSPASAMDLARATDASGNRGKGDGLLHAYPTQVEIALVDFDCRIETNYAERLLTIHREVEQQFLDQNRTQLEAMKAAALAEA